MSGKFIFRSSILASMGLTDRDDQYVCYAAVGGGLATYGRLTYKNFLLRQYINESDPVLKDIIAARFPFTEVELRGARQYLDRYKTTPRIWLILYPLAFIGYEVLKKGPKFWNWKKQSH
jgi:hypothetical protein